MGDHLGLRAGDWRERLAVVVDMMRGMSRETNPQEMVRHYGERVRQLMPSDRRLSLSRRGLGRPRFRITRSSTWAEAVNPWKDKERLPLLVGGLLAELIYGDETRLIDDLRLAADDPAAEYLAGHRSLLAIPLYDGGVAMNMVVLLRREPAAFAPEQVPEMVWVSNLFGRATAGLVLTEELQQAYRTLDHEFKVIGDLQRSLLPDRLPDIPSLDLAAYYQPSARAGGDYYDFFPLPDGCWGILIADVSGHGSPAAVLMAITHSIAHTHPGPPVPPGRLLGYVNHQLARRYTQGNENFVTAFYGIYDPARKVLTYACAGHPPPRLKRCSDGALVELDAVGGLPLGLFDGEQYADAEWPLQAGDQIVFYTDGLTETHNPAGEMFGTRRLDAVLENCALQASGLLDEVLAAVDAFTEGRPADDDRTVLIARVTAG
jgi:sigma-B regulation protein RsbU (phosphoserine phosphatase)